MSKEPPIQRKNLFILGAGVSVEHGYPTGQQLVEDIVNILEEKICLFKKFKNKNRKIGNKVLLALLLTIHDQRGCPKDNRLIQAKYKNYIELLKQFSQKLKFSNTRSIDDFLDRQSTSKNLENEDKEINKKIGKLIIFLRIMSCEEKSKNIFTHKIDKDSHNRYKDELFSENQDVYQYKETFYSYLWKSIYGNSYNDFLENLQKVSFITFNYDRLLENFLLESATSFFSVDTKKIKSDLKKYLNIHHVYGEVDPNYLSDSEGEIEYASDDIFIEIYQLIHTLIPDDNPNQLEAE